MNDDIFSGYGIEVVLNTPEDFLKIVETLTRIGKVKGDKTLSQICHILHKQGRYVIIHYTELLSLDGYDINITDEDCEVRDKIANLLFQWKLLKIKNPDKISKMPLRGIKIVSYKEKNDWKLHSNYHFSKKRKINND